MPVISFTVPLPPRSLRKNASGHWGQRKKDADEYSQEVWGAFNDSVLTNVAGEPLTTTRELMVLPWQKAHVLYVWKHYKIGPDHSNLGANTAHLQDIICTAPKLGFKQAEKYKRYHLGLVENDRGITAEFRAEKVKHVWQECVEITLTEIA